jgi:hypothetical protein
MQPRAAMPSVSILCFGMLFVLLAFAASPVPAQIVECRGVQTERGLKVLVDDFRPAGGAAASPDFMERLAAVMELNRIQLSAESGRTLKVLRCHKRFPSDASDFDPDFVRQLDGRDVILEFWGVLSTRADAQGRRVDEVIVRYVLIPLRQTELQSSQSPPGVYLVRLRAEPGAVSDLIDLFDQSLELSAFTALAIGLKAASSVPPDYDAATQNFCKAQTLLAESVKKDPKVSHGALVQHVTSLAAETVQKARRDTNYAGGWRLVSDEVAKSPCQRPR